MSFTGVLRPAHVQVRVTNLEQAVTTLYRRSSALDEVMRGDDGRVYLKAWDEFDHHCVVVRGAARRRSWITLGLQGRTERGGLDRLLGDAGAGSSASRSTERPEGEVRQPRGRRRTPHRAAVRARGGALCHEIEQTGTECRHRQPRPVPPDISSGHRSRTRHRPLPCVTGDDPDANAGAVLRRGRWASARPSGWSPDLDKTVDLARLMDVVQRTRRTTSRSSRARTAKLHHFAYSLADWSDILQRRRPRSRMDDVSVDVGPTRHGITRGTTIYFFDPSGNRNEVFSGGYQ